MQQATSKSEIEISTIEAVRRVFFICLEKVNPKYRELLIRRYALGESVHRIARDYNCSHQNISRKCIRLGKIYPFTVQLAGTWLYLRIRGKLPSFLKEGK